MGKSELWKGLLVQPLDPACRNPLSATEELTVKRLKQKGAAPFPEMIDYIARQLFFDEVRRGGALLDIGLFGLNLFRPQAVSELKAGDGILWKIEELGE